MPGDPDHRDTPGDCYLLDGRNVLVTARPGAYAAQSSAIVTEDRCNFVDDVVFRA